MVPPFSGETEGVVLVGEKLPHRKISLSLPSKPVQTTFPFSI